MLGRWLLADHARVNNMPEETLAQPFIKPIDSSSPNRFLEWYGAALAKILPNRMAGAAEFL